MSESAVTLDWDEGLNLGRWGSLMREVPNGILEQHWPYGEAVAAHSRYRVRRGLIRRGSEKLALIQTFDRRMPFFPFVWAKTLRGPLFLGEAGQDVALRQQVFSAIAGLSAKLRGRFHFWMPERPAGTESAAEMSGLGLRPMLSGYSSANLDLLPEPDDLRRRLRGKWRNALVQAEAEGLAIDISRGGKWLDWLAQAHDQQRRERRFNAPSGAMISTMAQVAPRDCFCLVALRKREPLAGALFFRHGNSATYYVGVGTESARVVNAQNLLLWRGMLALRNEGVSLLDLGGIDTRGEPGIARFKLGLGPVPFTLAGTWA